MKRKRILLMVFLLFSLMSCQEENKVPSCKIVAPQDGEEFTLGDSVTISIKANDPDGYIRKLQLWFDEIELVSVKDTLLTERIETSDYVPGEHIIKAIATDWEGSESSDEKQIIINATLLVVSAPIQGITETSAQSGGSVKHDGGSAVTDRGVCWSTLPGPTISDSKTIDGSGTGSFTSEITGLSPGTMYYVRAYVTNNIETKYGVEHGFKTFTGSVTDYDGNVYGTIQIGDQTWMGENLRTTHYVDGSAITLAESNHLWGQTGQAYCWYDNDIANRDIYGALYKWSAATWVCPDGWHLPSDSEWKQLEIFLGMNQDEVDLVYQFRGPDVGSKLKGTGTSLWNSPNTGATNKSGFNALPGGIRSWSDRSFYNAGGSGFFWTATQVQNDNTTAWHRHMSSSNTGVFRGISVKGSGYSVRCVKD